MNKVEEIIPEYTPPTFEAGQIWEGSIGGYYIIAQTHVGYFLISLRDGSSLHDEAKELNELIDLCRFSLVETPLQINPQ